MIAVLITFRNSPESLVDLHTYISDYTTTCIDLHMNFVYVYIDALLTDSINSSVITFLLANVINYALLKTRFHFISLSMLLYAIAEG